VRNLTKQTTPVGVSIFLTGDGLVCFLLRLQGFGSNSRLRRKLASRKLEQALKTTGWRYLKKYNKLFN
jgi:hypothetical protein